MSEPTDEQVLAIAAEMRKSLGRIAFCALMLNVACDRHLDIMCNGAPAWRQRFEAERKALSRARGRQQRRRRSVKDPQAR